MDKADTEWAVVQWWMSSLLVSRGGGKGRCGCRSKSKVAPTYYVDEGGIVTVGLRAPRTKGGFRMLKTKVAEILEGGGRFCRPRDRSYPVSTNFGPC